MEDAPSLPPPPPPQPPSSLMQNAPAIIPPMGPPPPSCPPSPHGDDDLPDNLAAALAAGRAAAAAAGESVTNHQAAATAAALGTTSAALGNQVAAAMDAARQFAQQAAMPRPIAPAPPPPPQQQPSSWSPSRAFSNSIAAAAQQQMLGSRGRGLKHGTACGRCANCLRADCGQCINCRDKTKFGGPNTRKKQCIHKDCVDLQPARPKAPSVPYPGPASANSMMHGWPGASAGGGGGGSSSLRAPPFKESVANAAANALAGNIRPSSSLGEDGVYDGVDSFDELSEGEDETMPPSLPNGTSSHDTAVKEEEEEAVAPSAAASTNGPIPNGLPNGIHPPSSTDASVEQPPAASSSASAQSPSAAASDVNVSSLFKAAAQSALSAPVQTCMPCAPSSASQANTSAGGTSKDSAVNLSSVNPIVIPPTAVCALCGVGAPDPTKSDAENAGAVVCGRMLPLGVGSYVHLNCAIWSSEVFERELGVLYQVPSAVRRSRRTICGYCGQPGASVGCMSKRCDQSYHFACALQAGVTYAEDSLTTWCPYHTPKKSVKNLPTYVERSVRIKPLNRLQILPDWQRMMVEEQAEAAKAQAAASQAAASSSTDTQLMPPPPPPPPPTTNPTVILRIGALRVLKLGEPQPTRPAFHDANTVTPLGYLARRRFHDVLEPNTRCEYLCEVSQDPSSQQQPLFSITHEREPSIVFRGKTATEAWQLLITRRNRVAHMRPPQLTPARAKLEAAIFFGFGAPAVAQLIEQLNGTKACEGFKPRYSLPEAGQKAPPLPRSATGCARTDGYIKRSSAYKFEHSMYYRGFINRGELPEWKVRRRDGLDEDAPTTQDERTISLSLRRRGEEGPKTANQVAMRPGGVLAMLRQPHPVRVGRSPIHNWGLFTTKFVPKVRARDSTTAHKHAAPHTTISD